MPKPVAEQLGDDSGGEQRGTGGTGVTGWDASRRRGGVAGG